MIEFPKNSFLYEYSTLKRFCTNEIQHSILMFDKQFSIKYINMYTTDKLCLIGFSQITRESKISELIFHSLLISLNWNSPSLANMFRKRMSSLDSTKCFKFLGISLNSGSSFFQIRLKILRPPLYLLYQVFYNHLLFALLRCLVVHLFDCGDFWLIRGIWFSLENSIYSES